MKHKVIGFAAFVMMSAWAAEPPRQLRFSLPVESLDFPACLAEPGHVAMPLVETNVNLEIVDWATEASAAPHDGEFLIALKQPTIVGTIMVYGAKEIRYAMDEGWTVLPTPSAEAGRVLQILPFPPSTPVRSVKIIAPSQPSGKGADGQARYRATLPFVTLIPLPLQRLGADMNAKTSSIADGDEPWARPELLLDGAVDPVRNFSVGERPGPVSSEMPEWILLSWKETQSVRGLWLLRGQEDEGWGQFKIEVFTGSGDPWESGNAEAWKEMAGAWTTPGAFRFHTFCAFFSALDGTGLRLTSTNGVTRPGLGELVVMQEVARAR